MDLMKGFYQIPMDPKDCCKTDFITVQGLFESDVMPFKLKDAPPIFQRAMQNLLVGIRIFAEYTWMTSSYIARHLRKSGALEDSSETPTRRQPESGPCQTLF